MSAEKCPGHSDGHHIEDWDGMCMGEGCNFSFRGQRAPTGEIERLRELAATCYAGLGAECNLPANWLDALNAAANGDPFTTEGLLPFATMPVQPAPAAKGQEPADALDAKRYRLIRRGQHWSVVDGIGNDLRAEALDAATDAALAQQPTEQGG